MLIRVFIGGALQEELIDLADDQLVDIARSELGELLGVRGEPLFHRIARLPASMPQYYVGHRQRVATIQQRAAAAGGLFLTGNAYHGVGIPFCIYGAEKAAERVCEYCRSIDVPSRTAVLRDVRFDLPNLETENSLRTSTARRTRFTTELCRATNHALHGRRLFAQPVDVLLRGDAGVRPDLQALPRLRAGRCRPATN